MSKWRIHTCILMLILALAAALPVRAAQNRALLISSYNPGFPTFFDQIEGVQSVLVPDGVELDVEFMDSKRFVGPQWEQRFFDLLSSKIELLEQPYDIILTADDNALHFALKNRLVLFSETPIVFFGLNDVALGQSLGADTGVTGVLEAPSKMETLSLMSQLFPHADFFYVLTDGTPSGQADVRVFEHMLSPTGKPVRILSLADMSWGEAVTKLEKLDVSTPVLLLSAYVDSTGHRKTFEQSLEWLMAHTRAPIFHLWEHGVGQGLLGGRVVSHFQQGRIAGLLARDILAGKPVMDIPIVDPNDANRYYFDYSALKRFDLDTGALPDSTVFINKPISIFDDYLFEVVAVISGIGLLILIGALHLGYSFKLRRYSQAEKGFRKQFESMFDNAAAGIAVLDMDGNFLKVNSRFSELVRYSEQELLGMTRYDLAHPADIEGDAEYMTRLIQGELMDEPVREKRLVAKNGDVIWISLSGSVLRDQEGNPEKTVAVIQDITERKVSRLVMRYRLELAQAINDLTLHQLLVRTIDFAEEMLESEIGFFHFIDDDPGYIRIQAWSTRTSERFCSMSDMRDRKYPVARAGMWLDAYRQQQPVIHNDVPNSSGFKGMPTGHATVGREVVVPIIRGGNVLAVVGVGNKQSDYTERDVRNLSLLTDMMWDTIEQKRAYDTLRVSESKFSKIFNAAPVMIHLTTLDKGVLVDVNERFLEVFGYSREEVLGRSVIEMGWISEEMRSEFTEEINKTGTLRNKPLTVADKHGEEILCMYSAERLEIGGEPYLLSLGRDITEQVRAEERIQETQHQYQQLFNAGGDAIFVHPYVKGRFLPFAEVNDAACSLLDVSQEELTGMTFMDVAAKDEGTAKDMASAIHELDQTRFTIFEVKLVPKFGPPIPVEVSSRRFEIGETDYVLSIARNVSARKIAEQEKERLSQDYHDLFSKMLEGFAVHEIVCDENGDPVDYRFLAVNPAFEVMTGLSAANVVGQTGSKVVPEFETGAARQFGKVALGGESVVFQQYSSAVDKHFQVTAFQNAPNQFACIYNDISDQKKGERNLREAKQLAETANQLKSDFMANMSHEIRTPLNGIMGMLQLLERSTLGEEQSEFVGAALLSCRRLTRLLCDILDHSRVETGNLSIDIEPFSMAKLTSDLNDLFQITAMNEGLDLSVSCSPELPGHLLGDPNRLTQVLGNLVGNAIKFTETGRISMTVDPLPSQPGNCRVLIVVSDTGIGIPDEKLSVMFKPFMQVSGGYTRKFEGAGLGLSICKDLVVLMGGSLCVDSEVGKGSAFYLSLTFTVAGEEAAEKAPSVCEIGSEFSGRRILVVEDDPVNSYALKRVLHSVGIDPICVENGQDALAALSDEAVDAVVMDIQMPVMDGVDTTVAIRNGEAGEDKRDIPIIALTAYAMPEDRETFAQAGMDGYVPKPFEQDKLFEALQAAWSDKTEKEPM